MVSSSSVPGEEYDRRSELEAFDRTKIGVKGLVDSGISKLPRIFRNTYTWSNYPSTKLAIPIIDLQEIRSEDPRKREQLLEKLKYACEEWGFFQVLNHGIPVTVLDEILTGVKKFHEQDEEMKKPYYSRDETKKFKYFSNVDLYSGPVTNWRDSISCIVAPANLDPSDLPQICRDIVLEYAKQVKKLGLLLLELFSEALGLKPDHLKEMECGDGIYMQGHYSPACPEPEFAIGTSSHADTGFFTILLQDNSGGLQILHDNHWVDVDPITGALVINVGDFLQLISNDRFKSVVHRVLALGVGPRVSVGCFFRTHFQGSQRGRLYGPLTELVSDEKPPIYKETTIHEYLTHYFGTGMDGSSGLSRFKLDRTTT